MWKCPDCGREFAKTQQSHSCPQPTQTIEDYITAQAADVQPRLRELYAIIKAELPEATEKLSWQMPTFWQGRNVIHFAAFKHHISLFPGGELTTLWAEQLTDYKTGKGTIQLPHDKPLPRDLITDITVWCRERHAK